MKIKGPITFMNASDIHSYEAGQVIPFKIKTHVYLIPLQKKHRAW